jgi:hypothetical protein
LRYQGGLFGRATPSGTAAIEIRLTRRGNSYIRDTEISEWLQKHR